MRHSEGHVSHEIQHGIATIEFFHPSSNSLPSAILTDLAKTINDIGLDHRVKVVVLRSGINPTVVDQTLGLGGRKVFSIVCEALTI